MTEKCPTATTDRWPLSKGLRWGFVKDVQRTKAFVNSDSLCGPRLHKIARGLASASFLFQRCNPPPRNSSHNIEVGPAPGPDKRLRMGRFEPYVYLSFPEKYTKKCSTAVADQKSAVPCFSANIETRKKKSRKRFAKRLKRASRARRLKRAYRRRELRNAYKYRVTRPATHLKGRSQNSSAGGMEALIAGMFLNPGRRASTKSDEFTRTQSSPTSGRIGSSAQIPSSATIVDSEDYYSTVQGLATPVSMAIRPASSQHWTEITPPSQPLLMRVKSKTLPLSLKSSLASATPLPKTRMAECQEEQKAKTIFVTSFPPPPEHRLQFPIPDDPVLPEEFLHNEYRSQDDWFVVKTWADILTAAKNGKPFPEMSYERVKKALTLILGRWGVFRPWLPVKGGLNDCWLEASFMLYCQSEVDTTHLRDSLGPNSNQTVLAWAHAVAAYWLITEAHEARNWFRCSETFFAISRRALFNFPRAACNESSQEDLVELMHQLETEIGCSKERVVSTIQPRERGLTIGDATRREVFCSDALPASIRSFGVVETLPKQLTFYNSDVFRLNLAFPSKVWMVKRKVKFEWTAKEAEEFRRVEFEGYVPVAKKEPREDGSLYALTGLIEWYGESSRNGHYVAHVVNSKTGEAQDFLRRPSNNFPLIAYPEKKVNQFGSGRRAVLAIYTQQATYN